MKAVLTAGVAAPAVVVAGAASKSKGAVCGWKSKTSWSFA